MTRVELNRRARLKGQQRKEAEAKKKEDTYEADLHQATPTGATLQWYGHVRLGSKQTSVTLQELQARHPNDLAFKDFRKRLIGFLNQLLPASDIALPGERGVELTAESKVDTFSARCKRTANKSCMYHSLDHRVSSPENQL